MWYLLAQTPTPTATDMFQFIMVGGLPAVGAVAIVIGVKLILKSYNSSEEREKALSGRLTKLEDDYRTSLVTLHKTTTDSLNANTKAIESHTLAVAQLHNQAEKNHAATSALLDQVISNRAEFPENYTPRQPSDPRKSGIHSKG